MNKYVLIWTAAVMLATAGGARGDEERGVAALKKADARITRDEDLPGKPVIEIHIGMKLTDAARKELAALKDLRSLTIRVCPGFGDVDAELKALAGLTRLRSLDLFDCKLTDAGLKGLTGLKNLLALNLSHTPVTDVGLKHLTGLKELRSLNINSTKVTDAGLKSTSPGWRTSGHSTFTSRESRTRG
jgi:hypothetical protein